MSSEIPESWFDDVPASTTPSDNSSGIPESWFDKENASEKNPETSSGGAFAHEAARSVIPGVAGIAGGAAAGAAMGAIGGPLAPITVPVGALVGGIAAGMGARKLQDVAADQVAPDSFLGTKQAAQEAQEHPYASFAGGLVGMGKPSVKSLGGLAKAVGTAEGRAGISTVAQALGKKGGSAALQETAKLSTPEGEAAKEALEHFGHAVGGIAGVGTQTGMGIAEGEDPGTAAVKGLAGMAIKPWAGPGGVFLDPFKISSTATSTQPKPAPKEIEAEEPVATLTPEEQAAFNESAAKVDEATNAAIQSNLEVGNEQTAAALSEIAATPISKSPVDDTTTQEVQTKAPKILPAAQAEADRLSVDISQVPPNKFGNVTKAEVQRWNKANPKNEVATAPQQQGTPANEAGPDIATSGEVSPQVETPPRESEVVAQRDSEILPPEPELNEEEIPEHAFEEPEQPLAEAVPLASLAGGEPLLPASDVTEIPAALPTGEVTPVAGSQDNRVAEVKSLRPNYPKGGAARTFVSPNTEEGLNVDQAVGNLVGKQHADLASVADRALETFPVDASKGNKQTPHTRSDAVGTLTDNGGENSLLIRHNGEVDPDALRATAATLAAHGDQKQALIFHKSSEGKDQMYEFTLPGMDIKQASSFLESWAKENGYENGFGNRTLEKDGDGTRVTIVNSESDEAFTETNAKVKDFANQHELKRNIYFGTAESLGDPTGESREVARNKYAEVIKRYVSRRTDGGDTEGGRGNGQESPLDLDQRHRHRIWELAQEIGLDAGDRPEGLPQESPDEGTLASTEVDPEEIRKAESGIPTERSEEYGQILAKAQKSLELTARSEGYSGYSRPLMELAVNRAWDQLRVRMGKFLTEHPEAELSQSEFNKIASGNLSNAVEVIGNRLNNEMAYGDVNQARKAPESVDLDTQNDSTEGGVGNIGQGAEGSGAFSPAEKEAVFKKIQDSATPVADKIALGRHLYGSGSLQKTEIERLTKMLPEQKAISADDFQDSQDIFNQYDADQIMRGEHRDENGNLVEEKGVLRALAVKPTELLGKTPSGVRGKIIPEEPSVNFAENLTEAKEALKVIMTQPEQRVTKGRLGTPVDFGTADHKLRERLGQPLLDLRTAKILHATGTSESNYQTPDADKVRTAPLIFQTVRQADLAGDFQTEFTQRQNAAVDDSRFHKTDRFYIKLYNDPESPTGVRWHTVVTDHDGNFVTQFSSPELGGNAANRGTVTAAGQRAPKTKKSPHLLHNPADTVTESVDQKATISGDKATLAQSAEGIKQKISGMSEEQVIQRAVELGAKQDAGPDLTPEELAEQQAINEDPRFVGSPELEHFQRPEPDNLNAQGQNGGAAERGKIVQTTHAEDVLQRILKDPRNDSMTMLVAQHLLDKFGASGRLRSTPVDVHENLESGILGEYDRKTGRIALETSSDAETALEEVLHSLTADKRLPQKIQDLFTKIRDEAVRKGLTSKDQWTRAADPTILNKEEGDAFHYAFSDPHELLAAALKNRAVRDALNNLEVRDSITGKLVNAWEKLRDTFKRMLGFQVKEDSALDQYLNQMFDHMAERGDRSEQEGTLAARKSLTAVYNSDLAEATLSNLNQNIYEPDRVPQTTREANQGSDLEAAESIARGSQRAISDAQTAEPKATRARPGNRIFTSPEEALAKEDRHKINQAARPLEEAALRDWAEKNGKIIDSDEFARKWEDGGEEGKDGFKAGAEHAVYFDPTAQRWVKTNNLEFHGSYLDYLQRMMLHNELFPETAYRLDGFTDFTPYPQPGTEKKFQPVVSQEHIKSLRGATRPEVVRDMDKRGFRWIKDDDYVSDDGSTRVEDLHDENAVVMGMKEDGSPIIAYIDPVIHQTPDTKSARIRKVVAADGKQSLNAIKTSKNSRSIFNDPNNPTEYEPTTLDKSESEAGKYVKSFDDPREALADLQQRGALISPEAKFPAARMIQASYEKKVADLMARKANGETISSPELTAAQRGRDQAYKLAGELKSKAGQTLVSVKGDNQYAASTYLDTFMKSTLGGTFDELTEGKVNVDALKEGMATIKQQVADVTVNSAKRLLSVFGITEPEAIDRIKAELGDLNNDPKNFKGVISELIGPEANPQKASALAQQLNSLYSAAHARMAPSRMAELVNRTYSDVLRKGGQKALADRLATQIKQGRFDEDVLNGTLLDSIGITGYDADTVKKLRDQVNFLQSQPEGSAQRNLAADKLKGALANMEMNEMIKSGFKGKMHAAFDLIPDLFRSAVLTSPATTTMHGAGGLVNTRVQAFFDAMGNFKAATNAGASFKDAAGFFKDFLDTCFVGDKGERGSPLIREAWRAVRTGTIGMGLAKGTGKRGADLHGDGVGSEIFQKYCKALAIPGRLMSAWDALNAGTAQEVNQKYAMRAALLNMGQKGPEIATKMKKVFAPTTEDLQAARDALDKEVNSGAFDSFTKPEQYFLKGERLEQLHKQIQMAQTDEELIKILGSEDIQSAVERYTYKGKPMGVWGAASDLLNTLNKNSKVTTLLVPFTNIVGHLMNTSLDFTPLGYMKAKNASLSNLFMPEGSKYAWPKMVEGSPEQIALMSKSIVGTAATAFITAWFLKELHDEEMTGKPPGIMFYGSGPKDPAKRQSWVASGAKADTIKIGNNYFPYKTLPAISLLGAALGAMHDMYIEDSIPKTHGGKLPTPQQIEEAHRMTWDKAMRLGVALAMTPLTHEYLSGLRNVITIAHDPEGPGAAKAVWSQVSGSASQLTNPSLLRTIRNANPIAADSQGNVPNLDLSSTTGKLFQFIPGYLGYNQNALNILGDPIEHKFFSPLTDRWMYAASATPDPIVATLVNNGLYLPEARRSTPLIVDRLGNQKKVADAGDEAWRSFQIARGEFLKKVLNPQLVTRLTQMDRVQAQAILMGPSIAGASAKYAQAIVERDILRGKIKVKS